MNANYQKEYLNFLLYGLLVNKLKKKNAGIFDNENLYKIE